MNQEMRVNTHLTLDEAAAKLRRAPKTLRHITWLDRLHARKVGGRWLVPVEVVDALLTAQPMEGQRT